MAAAAQQPGQARLERGPGGNATSVKKKRGFYMIILCVNFPPGSRAAMALDRKRRGLAGVLPSANLRSG